jgi:hypothetical protein
MMAMIKQKTMRKIKISQTKKYRLKGMDKSPGMIRRAYAYKTTNDGKRNDLKQNHEEFDSLVVKDFYGQKKHCFVDVPKDFNITIDWVDGRLKKRLMMKSKNNKLLNHYLNDDLLYAKNAKAINTAFIQHEKEITNALKH